MRIAIDVREACKTRKSGKGQWVLGLLRELARRPVSLVTFSNLPLPPALTQARNIEEHVMSGNGLLWHWKVARAVRRSGVEVYVSPTSYIVPCVLGASFPVVPVVHDLIAFRDATHERRARYIERLTLRRVLKTARHVCTVSETTKRDLLEHFPSVTPDRVTPIFAGPLRESVVPHSADQRTVLCAGTLSPRKNQKRLIEAFAELPAALQAQYKLLLIGNRGWKDEEILSLASKTPGVEWRDYVPDAEYESLLSSCTILALPSLYEGFGLQVLDALQRGIPVLTSTRGSLREVCGNAAHYVDPENISSIAAGLELLLTSERVRFDLHARAQEQAKKYSWRRTADLLLNVLART